MPSKQYIVVFEGKIAEGFDKETLLQNLSRLYKKDEASIEQQLFTGKPVVIKKTEDRVEAERFLKDFRNAGAEVIIKESTATPAVSQPQSEGKRKRWPKIAVATVLIIAALAGGAYWYINTKLLDMSVPEAVLKAEEALATENLIALGHANIAKAVEIEKMFLGAEDPGALPSPTGGSFIEKLIASGIKPREQLKQLLLALHLGNNDNGHYSAVLLGNFNRGSLIKFLKREYIVEESKAGKESVMIFTKQKIDDCSFSPKRSIHVTKNRILITSPDHMETLLGRFDSPPSKKIDLTAWRQYRSKHLVSTALFAPQHTDKAADGIVAMILSGLKEKIAPVHSGFAGASAQLMPPGLKLDLSLNSKDRNWVSTTTSSWQKMIKEQRESAGKQLSSLAKLFDPLTIDSTDEQLKAELVLSGDLKKNISDIVSEVIGSMFSFSAGSNVTNATEKLDENPTPFVADYPESRLKPFNKELDPNFVPDMTVGPFGVRVDALRINNNEEVEIVLEAQGREIENLGKSYERASLSVTSAKDNSGNELLKEEKCGRERNSKPAKLNSLMDFRHFKYGKWEKHRKVDGKKTIRLKKGVTLKKIASLDGAINLNLPVQTESKIIKGPFTNQVVERGNLRLRFNEGSDNQLSYSVSGDESLLIAVRGMNKDKKHLSSASSSSTPRLFGKGKSVTKDYQGQVEYAEIVFAKKIKELKYPFTLGNLYPTQRKGSLWAPMKIETYSLKRLDREFANTRPSRKPDENSWLGLPELSLNLPPFLIELYKLNIGGFRGCSGTLEVVSPVIPSLTDNMMALELRISEAVTEAGESIAADFSNFIRLRRDGFHSNGKFIPNEKKNYIEGQVGFSFPYDKKTIKTLKGNLLLRIPKKTKKIIMEELSLGNTVSGGGFTIGLKEIATGNIKLTLKGERGRIIGFNVFNKNGDVISASPPHFELKDEKKTVRLNHNGTPARIEMIVAEQVESREFPFSLEVKK